jgi:hypothetical protein
LDGTDGERLLGFEQGHVVKETPEIKEPTTATYQSQPRLDNERPIQYNTIANAIPDNYTWQHGSAN